MPFEPKPLLNFERGLYAAKEPWISPENAWQVLQNAKLDKGRVLKRKGYKQFARLGIAEPGENIGDGGVGDSGTLDIVPIRPPAYISDEADTFHILIEDGTYEGKGWSDPYYDTRFSQPYFLVYQRVVITGFAGLTNYAGSLVGVNNPRTPITFDETGGATRQIVIDYIAGPQYGPQRPTQGVTSDSDADPAGTNTWIPGELAGSNGAYDVTFPSATEGSVTVTYDEYIGYVKANGQYFFTYDVEDTWDDPVTCDYEWLSEEPIMGIHSWHTLDGDGVEYLVACDTDKIYLYNVTTGNFGDPLGSFTGDDSQYFHFCSFEDILIVNNGKDPPQKYTPATPAIAEMGTNYNAAGTPTNDIQSAKFCFRKGSRIIYIGLKEGGDWYLNRARWTPVNDIEYAGAVGTEASYYTDAATTDRLVAAAQIGGEIVAIFGTSVWHLRDHEADPFNAYRWEQLPAVEGTASPMGHVSLGDALLYRGHEGINLTDARGVQAADLEIPDEVLTWNLDAEKYSYGVFVPAEHEALITYADAGDSYAERALVAHLDRDRKFKGWSKYDLPFHCFGRYRRGAVQSWDDAVAGLTVDEIEWSLDSLGKSVGFPVILAGDRSGNIFEYADGYSDDGEDVTATVRTIRLNPYPGRTCHLGWIDIIADTVTSGEITVTAYANYSSTAYMNRTVNLTASGESSKVNRRVRVNRIAHLHSIQIAVKSSGPFALDAITLWCQPGGRMRGIA